MGSPFTPRTESLLFPNVCSSLRVTSSTYEYEIVRDLIYNFTLTLTNAVIHVEESANGHSGLGGLAGDP